MLGGNRCQLCIVQHLDQSHDVVAALHGAEQFNSALSQIYQLVKAIKNQENMYAIVAPAFIGQFGPIATPTQIFEAIKMLGFKEVLEVGLGADIGTIHEAEEFLDEVPNKVPYMGTSCCPAWLSMVEKMFPDQARYISDTSTPMIATASVHKEAQ